MLRQIVIFEFKESSSDKDVENIIRTFRFLKEIIREITGMENGVNVSPENWRQKFQTVLLPHMEKVFVVDYFAD